MILHGGGVATQLPKGEDPPLVSLRYAISVAIFAIIYTIFSYLSSFFLVKSLFFQVTSLAPQPLKPDAPFG